MRQPSPAAELYAWHRAAVAGEAPPIHDGLPECGWFKRRLVKGGPWVPVRIFVRREIEMDTGELLGPEILVADVDGKLDDPARHWTYLTPITRSDYEALLYRQSIVPGMADSQKPLDLTKEPIRWM
ncbi:hypothetical protein SAMN05421774_10888 [Gemmobacter megaterium]|uniref:Uncharacterized protein n=1 Tax=Gemmobacter megaterium TaxID=1086013 RepID=A0A1N7QBG6_9RHOB|nr:hypothetical protein [Gemmobacter megaterium]SIT20195.1 hypothetical protein SAMN05421774_10888 [Gemmobacter megaterium]